MSLRFLGSPTDTYGCDVKFSGLRTDKRHSGAVSSISSPQHLQRAPTNKDQKIWFELEPNDRTDVFLYAVTDDNKSWYVSNSAQDFDVCLYVY